MSNYLIEYACISDVGLVRTINQDNYICDGKYMDSSGTIPANVISGETDNSATRLFGVFDGMGGEDSGEIAAFMAAQEASEADLTNTGEADEVEGAAVAMNLRNLCMRANDRVCQYIIERDDVFSMGTTAAMLAFASGRVVLCNIGDSKVFLLSDNIMRQISQDHLMFAPYGTKPPLSQNIGIPESELIIDPYIDEIPYNDGDIYLICSDGLTDMLKAYEIEEILTNGTDIGSQAVKLVNDAKDNGGKDNITVIILRVNAKE